MDWISTGGPYVLMPMEIARQWRGVDVDGEDENWDDYEAACAAITSPDGIHEWSGIVERHGGTSVVRCSRTG